MEFTARCGNSREVGPAGSGAPLLLKPPCPGWTPQSRILSLILLRFAMDMDGYCPRETTSISDFTPMQATRKSTGRDLPHMFVIAAATHLPRALLASTPALEHRDTKSRRPEFSWSAMLADSSIPSPARAFISRSRADSRLQLRLTPK